MHLAENEGFSWTSLLADDNLLEHYWFIWVTTCSSLTGVRMVSPGCGYKRSRPTPWSPAARRQIRRLLLERDAFHDDRRAPHGPGLDDHLFANRIRPLWSASRSKLPLEELRLRPSCAPLCRAIGASSAFVVHSRRGCHVSSPLVCDHLRSVSRSTRPGPWTRASTSRTVPSPAPFCSIVCHAVHRLGRRPRPA